MSFSDLIRVRTAEGDQMSIPYSINNKPNNQWLHRSKERFVDNQSSLLWLVPGQIPSQTTANGSCDRIVLVSRSRSNFVTLTAIC